MSIARGVASARQLPAGGTEVIPAIRESYGGRIHRFSLRTLTHFSAE
jgi:hypothetical protein